MKELMKLTRQILSGIIALYIFASLLYAFFPNEATANIFESVNYILPPLATLVIGFWFGQKFKIEENEQSAPATVNQIAEDTDVSYR